MKRKIGVFGGSFNPVHEGHLAVACGVLRSGLVDEVWFMPCRRNPLKDNEPEFAEKDRVELLRDKIESGAGSFNFFTPEMRGRLKITDVDFRLPSPSYTWKSLQQLSLENPDCDFRLIMGADSYLGFKNWKRPDWIRENFGLIIYPRPGYEIQNVEDNCVLLRNMKEYDISSTEIRNKLKSNGY